MSHAERCTARIRWDGHLEVHCYCWKAESGRIQVLIYPDDLEADPPLEIPI